MAQILDRNRLQDITTQMINALTSAPFVAAMKQLKETPPDQKLAAGARLLAPSVLKAQGVPLPEGIRVTSRYFEPGYPPIEVNDIGAAMASWDNIPPGLLGHPFAGGCCCGGAASACGGCGG